MTRQGVALPSSGTLPSTRPVALSYWETSCLWVYRFWLELVVLEKAEGQEGRSGICDRCNAICLCCCLRFASSTQPQFLTRCLSQKSSVAGWLASMPHATHSSERCVPRAKGLCLSQGDNIPKPRNKSEKILVAGSGFLQWDCLSLHKRGKGSACGI